MNIINQENDSELDPETQKVSVDIHSVPLLVATEENIKPYGNIFTDIGKEQSRVERWPQA
eukprot:Awhi_evm1s2447